MIVPQILTLPIEKVIKVLFNVTIAKVAFQTTHIELQGNITIAIFTVMKI